MKVSFENVTPGPEMNVQDYVDRYGIDVLNTVDSIFLGDALIESDSHTIFMPKVHFIDVAVRLFESAFFINFRGARDRRIDLTTSDGPTFLNVGLEDGKFRMSFAIGANRVVVVDDQELRSGNNEFIYFDPIDFNLTCGILFEAEIDFLEDKFGHIDGIREAFYAIPFAETYEDLFYDK